MPMRKCFVAAAVAARVAGSFAASVNPPSTYVLPALSGTVVDAATGQGLAYAVVQGSWTLQPAAQKDPARDAVKRLYARQVHSKPGGLFIIPSAGAVAAPVGTALAPAQDPVVRIYAEGHQRLVLTNTVPGKNGALVPANAASAAERKWFAEKRKLALEPLPNRPHALKEELVVWKHDLESEIAASAAQDRTAAIRSQEKLLFLFDKLCRKLPEASRTGLCYAPDSELGSYVAAAAAERRQSLTIEEDNGRVTKIPVVVGSPSGAPRAAVAVPAGTSVDKLNEAYEREVRR